MDGAGGGSKSVHVLRTGSGKLGRGVGGQSHAGTRPVPPRRVCARQLHVGTSGSPCDRSYRLEVLRRVQLRVGRGKATPSPGRACFRPANDGVWGAVGGVIEHHAVRRRPPTGHPRTGAGYLPDNQRLRLVQAHGTFPREKPTSSFLLCSPFSDALGPPQAAYLDFTFSREWEVVVGHYRVLLAPFGIRSRNVQLRLTNRRLYNGPHV